MIIHFYMNAKTNCGLYLRTTELQPVDTGEVDLLGHKSHIAFFMQANRPGISLKASDRIIEVTCKRCKKERVSRQ